MNQFKRRSNEVRPHWALVPQGGGDPLTSADIYVHGVAVQFPKPVLSGVEGWQLWAKAAKEKLAQMMRG